LKAWRFSSHEEEQYFGFGSIVFFYFVLRLPAVHGERLSTPLPSRVPSCSYF
jgi:hypothetical protein